MLVVEHVHVSLLTEHVIMCIQYEYGVCIYLIIPQNNLSECCCCDTYIGIEIPNLMSSNVYITSLLLSIVLFV